MTRTAEFGQQQTYNGIAYVKLLADWLDTLISGILQLGRGQVVFPDELHETVEKRVHHAASYSHSHSR
jgi:hypothetical protein